jgi:hypothetical protein
VKGTGGCAEQLPAARRKSSPPQTWSDGTLTLRQWACSKLQALVVCYYDETITDRVAAVIRKCVVDQSFNIHLLSVVRNRLVAICGSLTQA